MKRFCLTSDYDPAGDPCRRHGPGNHNITANLASTPGTQQSDVTPARRIRPRRSRDVFFFSTATTPTTSPNYAGPMDAARYVIGPEDSLQVTVWKEPTLSGNFPVRPDGMISLVLVGDLPAAGQTPMALSNDITQRLKKYIQDPVVTVVGARCKQPENLYGG